MYKGLFNTKNKLKYLNFANRGCKKIISDGIYEKFILCRECDNEILGKNETYVSKLLYGPLSGKKSKIPIFFKTTNHEGLTTFIINNIDYKKTKLFLLSILWRAHISSHPFFTEVDLGPHAEILRKMILENNPKDENSYETVLTMLKKNSTRPYNSIIQPKRIKIELNTIYVFYINGLMYHYNISPINKLSLFPIGKVCIDNSMRIGYLEDVLADSYLDEYMK